MNDFVCPVCGAYGIPAREKAFARWHNYVFTCRGCGAKLGLGFVEHILCLVPWLVFVGAGYLLAGATGATIASIPGLLVAWWVSFRFVPLVPIRKPGFNRSSPRT